MISSFSCGEWPASRQLTFTSTSTRGQNPQTPLICLSSKCGLELRAEWGRQSRIKPANSGPLDEARITASGEEGGERRGRGVDAHVLEDAPASRGRVAALDLVWQCIRGEDGDEGEVEVDSEVDVGWPWPLSSSEHHHNNDKQCKSELARQSGRGLGSSKPGCLASASLSLSLSLSWPFDLVG